MLEDQIASTTAATANTTSTSTTTYMTLAFGRDDAEVVRMFAIQCGNETTAPAGRYRHLAVRVQKTQRPPIFGIMSTTSALPFRSETALYEVHVM